MHTPQYHREQRKEFLRYPEGLPAKSQEVHKSRKVALSATGFLANFPISENAVFQMG
jgi:hypothetical protein